MLSWENLCKETKNRHFPHPLCLRKTLKAGHDCGFGLWVEKFWQLLMCIASLRIITLIKCRRCARAARDHALHDLLALEAHAAFYCKYQDLNNFSLDCLLNSLLVLFVNCLYYRRLHTSTYLPRLIFDDSKEFVTYCKAAGLIVTTKTK